MRPDTPRFTRKFRRLCQVAAVTGSGRYEEVLDGLVPVAMVYDDGPWKTAADWTGTIESLFEIHLSESDVNDACRRAVTAERISFDSRTQTYTLNPKLREVTLGRISSGEELERRVQESWFSEIEMLAGGIKSEQLWDCLLGYASRAFLAHGADAVALLSGDELEEEVETKSLDMLLHEALEEAHIEENSYAGVAAAISVFFNGKNEDRNRYLIELTEHIQFPGVRAR